jgi:hypothetical protein
LLRLDFISKYKNGPRKIFQSLPKVWLGRHREGLKRRTQAREKESRKEARKHQRQIATLEICLKHL